MLGILRSRCDWVFAMAEETVLAIADHVAIATFYGYLSHHQHSHAESPHVATPTRIASLVPGKALNSYLRRVRVHGLRVRPQGIIPNMSDSVSLPETRLLEGRSPIDTDERCRLWETHASWNLLGRMQ